MHKEILSNTQTELLSLVQKFSKNFGLVGGTAIALQIGHRQSLDFDLFTAKPFHNHKIRNTIAKSGYKIDKTILDETGQFTIIVQGVQLTFLYYPFHLTYRIKKPHVKMPDLLTLAAMKAYALGRRAKWKDYVDLFFTMSKYHSIAPIANRARKIFAGEFNEKNFRQQLTYFKDINYSEKVTYLPGYAVPDKRIKQELLKFSTDS